jgi:PAS domain S-box-containing protein
MVMEKIPLDTFRLRFPAKLETEFLDDYFQKSLNQMRIGIILGALLYALFGYLDAWIFPEVRFETWFVRFVFVLPACIAVLLFSYSRRFKQYMQPVVFLLVVAAGAGIVAMMVIVGSPVNYFHFAGLVLVIMYSYTFSRLRFLYTILASWTVVILYEIAAFGFRETPLPALLNDNFFYIGANLIGMFSSYNRELYMRKDFYQNRIMHALEEERHVLEKASLRETVNKAVTSLQESEEKFRTLAETAAMAIFIHQGGNFLYANRAAQVIGGYSVAEYLTMNFLSLVHPDYLDLVKARARERLDGNHEVPTQYEFKILRKNGGERWVLMTGGITVYEGKPAVIGTLIDITERKKAEEELHQMALLIENSTDFIGMAGMDGRVLFVNSGGRRMMGIDRKEEVLGTSVADYFPEEDRQIFLDQIWPNLTWRGELRMRHFKTGRLIPVEMYAFSVNDEITEKPVARAAVIRDITDLKRAREERERIDRELQRALNSLRESETRFRTLAETTAAGIFIYREEHLIYVNPAGMQLSGYGSEQLLNMNFWEIIHPQYRDVIKSRAEARLRGQDVPKDYEFMIMTKSGEERWMGMTAGVTEYEGKPAVIATLFDVTDRKRAEEEKVKLYEQRIAEEKRHVLEKEKILMDLHDGIGGITTNISILSELAQQMSDIEGVKKKLATISRLSREGISEIRGFMKSLDTQELSWRSLAAELRTQGTSLLEPHAIAFDLESKVHEGAEQPGSLLWVNIFKIYKEALTNVVKHSKAQAVVVQLQVSERGFLLTIQDNGMGAESSGGNGRGLANMKRRAAEVGGAVAVSSGRGTLVCVEIPLPIKYPDQGIEL